MTFDRICTGCKEIKSSESFSKGCTQCKPCSKIARRKRTQTPEYKKKIQAKNHGLSTEEVDGIRWLQDNKCTICGLPDPTDLDHDHRCCDKPYGCAKCVRSLLCHKCNVILGWANDNGPLLRMCADYTDK